jgi:hypothetical protein
VCCTVLKEDSLGFNITKGTEKSKTEAYSLARKIYREG